MTPAALALLAVSGSVQIDSTCRVMVVSRRAGEIVREADTASVSCDTASHGRELRYDRRTGTVTAMRDLSTHEPLGRVWFAPDNPVHPGDRVRIAVRVGHVSLTREATALQPAGVSDRFFVRSDDGRVFVAPAAKGPTS